MTTRTNIKIASTLAISLLCLGSVQTFGKDTPTAKPAQAALSSVPAAELPAQAAKLIQQAKARQREARTMEVVKAALAINPAAAAPLVGAIAQAVPEMAAVAAGVAAAEQPGQAAVIARAAAAGAPSRAGKIVVAVCGAVPNAYRNIALAVAEVAPTASKEILKSVGAAVPELRPHIEKELAGYGLTLPPVANTLDLAITQARASGAPSVVAGMPAADAPPAPVIPGSGTTGNSEPNTAGGNPPGGRNYARP
jgi:hypothetical protein